MENAGVHLQFEYIFLNVGDLGDVSDNIITEVEMRENFLHLFRIKKEMQRNKIWVLFKRRKKREVNGISQLFFFTKFDQIFRVGSRGQHM